MPFCKYALSSKPGISAQINMIKEKKNFFLSTNKLKLTSHGKNTENSNKVSNIFKILTKNLSNEKEE